MIEARPRAEPNRRPSASPARVGNGGGDALAALKRAAKTCRDCPLWKPATQTVFGEGPTDADLVFVGEQPGDREDLAGRPFVGPAGRIFDRALADAGIDRARIYVTNAVKHFKFTPRGKIRLHQKPAIAEIRACHQWLERELDVIRPHLVIAMGTTAVRSIFGRALPIGRSRGTPIAFGADMTALVTVHPSFLLRVPEEERRAGEYAAFVADLKLARRTIEAA